QSDPTAKVLDKDRFRQDLGQVESAYQTVQQRVLAQIQDWQGK
ncbi:MAG: phosphoribosylaminoimidazolesuccinocarboxamide synthase, partial [Microcystaceae cyanobacterium]